MCFLDSSSLVPRSVGMTRCMCHSAHFFVIQKVAQRSEESHHFNCHSEEGTTEESHTNTKDSSSLVPRSVGMTRCMCHSAHFFVIQKVAQLSEESHHFNCHSEEGTTEESHTNTKDSSALVPRSVGMTRCMCHSAHFFVIQKVAQRSEESHHFNCHSEEGTTEESHTNTKDSSSLVPRSVGMTRCMCHSAHFFVIQKVAQLSEESHHFNCHSEEGTTEESHTNTKDSSALVPRSVGMTRCMCHSAHFFVIQKVAQRSEESHHFNCHSKEGTTEESHTNTKDSLALILYFVEFTTMF